MTEKEYIEKRIRKIAKKGRIKTAWLRKAGLYYQVLKHWGSVKNMQKALKLPLQTRDRKVNIEKHVQKIVDFIKKNKRFPKKREMGYTYYVLRYTNFSGIILNEVSKKVYVPQKYMYMYSQIRNIDKMIKQDPYCIKRFEKEKAKVAEIKEKIIKQKIYKTINIARHNVKYMEYLNKALENIKKENKRTFKKVIQYIAKYISFEDHLSGLPGYYLNYL